MYNTLWYVGSIIAAWTVFGTVKYTSDASWRIPVALQAAMPSIQFVGVWLLPESPRWLCAKGKTEDAFNTLVKVSMVESIFALGLERTYSQSPTNGVNAVSWQRKSKRHFL